MFVWDADPIAIQIGPIAIRWYSLCFLVSFAYGLSFMKRHFVRSGFRPAMLDSLLTYVIIGTIVGARLGHCLFYEPNVYLRAPWRILMVWEGGLASHGGAIGILLALYLYTKRHKGVDFLWLLDRIVIPVAFAGAMIRIGNLMNSEIVGHPSDLPWAVVFKRIDLVPRHPTQIYESIGYFVSFLILQLTSKRTNIFENKGKVFGLFLILIFGFRFFIEFIKENQVDFESRLQFDLGQLLSVPFVLIGIYFLFFYKEKFKSNWKNNL